MRPRKAVAPGDLDNCESETSRLKKRRRCSRGSKKAENKSWRKLRGRQREFISNFHKFGSASVLLKVKTHLVGMCILKISFAGKLGSASERASDFKM